LAFANDPQWRDKARRLLVAKYFRPNERVALYCLLGLPIPTGDEVTRDAALGSTTDAKKQGREARFRLNVVAAYDYACALTGYRLTTITAGSIVDAAHVHQFADSRNNDPRNGIALSKNAHWLFDNGLWTLTDDYKVIIAVGRFSEDSPDQKSLLQYHGQCILHVRAKRGSAKVVPAPCPLQPSPDATEARHSPDFRSVRWFGTLFTFTPVQAACVQILWETWTHDPPEVGQHYILENVGAESTKLSDVFKGRPAWGTMIRPGSTRGAFRLEQPRR
jgi:putative restriction endonuclease